MASVVSSLQRTLSRLELTIAAIVIFILVAVFLRQILILAARAEKKFLEVSIININTSLHYQGALLYLKGQHEQLKKMDGMNPFQLAQSAIEIAVDDNVDKRKDFYKGVHYRVLPARYLGEVDYLDAETVKPGYWIFDRAQKTLVYRVSNDEYFYSDIPGEAHIRYRVVVNYEDRNANNRYDPGTDKYLGIELKNLGGFRWEP